MKKNFLIPKISQKEFVRRLKKRHFENFVVINMIEKFFLKKRGYIFRMPKPGTPVILLVSGGLDSTITWGLLMEKYKLLVYPLFLHRGVRRYVKEKKSLDFFSRIFQKKYPNNYIAPFEFSAGVDITELEKLIPNSDLNNYYHPSRILENFNIKTGVSEITSPNGTDITYPIYGTSYARYLFYHKGVKIRTIFNAVATEDGAVVTSQTFTALRTAMLAICVSTGNYDWQFASLPLEKELGHWIDKSEYIHLGAKLNLPLEKTWSCYHAGKYQCGDGCSSCLYRRREFAKSGISDKTIYECNIVRLRHKLYLKIKYLKSKIKKLINNSS